MPLRWMGRAIRWAALAALALVPAAARAADPVAFNRDVRPILSENCFACHGPDKAQRKADLRLDLRDDAIAQEAIVPGKPEESLLIDRIFTDDRDELMPPPKSHKVLSAEQKETLRRWVAEGAAYQGHWAYERPVKPAVPEGANGIDTLVARRLEKRGAYPAPEADRRTLARRLSLDLLGLPPAPEEVAAFVADESPDAYEKLVDRLLSSPHYGERMAIGWLDVVRFADTIGYHSDNPRDIWPYRDYVIRSFNRNTPFDRFTVEQLAGDLLPDATVEQKVASAFNRLLLTTEEGGAQPKDYEARMLTDRVRAVGTVWLGQTFGCCQCHDHKFDPITIRDFYAMGAFFADISEPIIGGRGPGMPIHDDEQAKELTRLRAEADELQRRESAPDPAIDAARDAWEKAVLVELNSSGRWAALRPEGAISERGARLSADGDGVVSVEGGSEGGVDIYRLTVKTALKGISGFRLDALTGPSLPSRGPGRAANGNFVLSEFKVNDASGRPIPLSHASATFEQTGFPASQAIDTKGEPGNGWAIMGATGSDQAIVFETAGPVGDGKPTTLTVVLHQEHGAGHTLGRFRLSAIADTKPVRAPRVAVPPREVVELIRIDPSRRDDAQRSKLSAYFRQAEPSALADLRGRIAAARKRVEDYEASLPRCLVSVAMKPPRTVRILPRGNWMDESGPVVAPGLPGFLPRAKEFDGRPLNRLDLARWLVARENPLTARVFMNRLWARFFGAGLSRTPDDLGSQGEWPSHPELLDWLACEFIDCGWDVKKMVRAIVTSRTYRQSSTASKEWLARDPANRELARQGRFRLDAEAVRDNALAIAGLLASRVGGPSVKPYQPDGYWDNLNFPPRQYVADSGPSEYRRGLYTWWQRSFPNPSLIAFDAPSREECIAERSRSNTPQQALVLLNDPTYVEAARAFAARIIREGGASTGDRIEWAWRQALQRPPRDDERATVTALVEKQGRHYASDRPAAEALLKVGQTPRPEGIDAEELAAWTGAARVLLNLHETITRN